MSESLPMPTWRLREVLRRRAQEALDGRRSFEEYTGRASTKPLRMIEVGPMELLQLLDEHDRVQSRLPAYATDRDRPEMILGTPEGLEEHAISDEALRRALIAFAWRVDCRGVLVQQAVNRLCAHLGRLIEKTKTKTDETVQLPEESL